jgi:1,4-dihydroxy-2-naphthoyl-CoA hydrolase
MDDTIDLQNTLMEHLGIEAVEMSAQRVVMKMPVGPRVHQPHGLLHGGASVALAESAASIGTVLGVDRRTHSAVGMEINANHLRPVREGWVTAEAVPLHRGRTSMVWDVRIRDDRGRLVCVSRCTVAIVARRG